MRDAKPTGAPAPTAGRSGRGAALRSSADDFTASLKIPLPEEPACPGRGVPPEGSGGVGRAPFPSPRPGRAGRCPAPSQVLPPSPPRQVTVTRRPPAEAARPTPPTLPLLGPGAGSPSPLLRFPNSSGRPSTTAFFKAGTALAQPRPYRGEERRPRDAFLIPEEGRKGEGDDPSRAGATGAAPAGARGGERPAPPPRPSHLRPAAGEVEGGSGGSSAPHAGQPPPPSSPPFRPRRSGAAPAAVGRPRVAEEQQQQTPTRRASQSSQS